jgi:hypothetical protein
MGLDKENKNYCYNLGRVVALVEIVNGLQITFAGDVFNNAKDKLPYQLKEALRKEKHNLHGELIDPADVVLNSGELPSKPMTTVDVTGKYWIGYYHEKAYLADAYKGIYGIEEYIIEHHSPERIDVPEGMDNSIDELRK